MRGTCLTINCTPGSAFITAIGAWGNRWLPADPELRDAAATLDSGGPRLQGQFMRELRHEHLEGHQLESDSLRQRLLQS